MFDENLADKMLEAQTRLEDTRAMMADDDKKESLCRFHKKKQMSFCKNDNPDVQKTCKYYADPSKYLNRPTCAYWDTTDIGVVVGGWHHCKHPDAQVETYHTPQLQVDE